MTLGGRPVIQPWLAAENARVACASDVRQLAGEREVRLLALKGSGPDGVITRADVLAVAAEQDRQRAAAHRRAFPEPAAAPEPRVSFTASGLPVSVLDEVPPSVRRALAAAPDHATAFALVGKYQGLADAEARAELARDRSVSCDHGGIGPTRRTVPGWN